MDRAAFATLVAGAAASLPLGALARRLEGSLTTQGALFAALPPIAPGTWTRIILGSGAQYQKQIGAGVEHDSDGRRLLYFETQVGSPGGSCNPSSMRKAYLRAGRFGSLIDTYALTANIGRTENMIYRFADLADGNHRPTADNTLRLLDERFLYDERPLRIVSVAPQRIHAANRTVDATHVVAQFVPGPRNARQRLKNVQLWHHPDFPFGVVQYRAEVADLEPFTAHVYSFGTRFTTMLSLSLERVRMITPDGQYGQLPEGVGAGTN